MSSHLASCCISHLTSPPHTPEHNSYAKHRHRHIVETGLALLSHANTPTKFWPLAFTTATYLISRLPTSTLNHASPFYILFNKLPNYHKLRSFSCLAYPWLRPYSHNKLQQRSTPCIFVGYSSSQSAYHLLDPLTNRIYTSRHVHFVEHVFPYTSITNTSNSSPPDIDTWSPLTTTTSIPVPNSSTTTTEPPLNTTDPSSPPPTIRNYTRGTHNLNPPICSPEQPPTPTSSSNSPPPSHPFTLNNLSSTTDTAYHTRQNRKPNSKYHNEDYFLYHSTPHSIPDPSTITQA